MKKIIAFVICLSFMSAVGFAAVAETKPASDNSTTAPAPKAKKKQMQGC